MAVITHLYACLCGVETPVEPEEIGLGRVFQCPACREVRAHVRPQGGGSAWIRVSPEDVEFNRLLRQPEEE